MRSLRPGLSETRAIIGAVAAIQPPLSYVGAAVEEMPLGFAARPITRNGGKS